MQISVDSLLGLGTEVKLQGRLHGISDDHVIVVIWFKQPLDVNLDGLISFALEKMEQIGVDIDKIPDVNEFAEKRKVQNHDVTCFNATGKYKEFEGVS